METILIIIGIMILLREVCLGDRYSGPKLQSDRMNYPNIFKRAIKNEKKIKNEKSFICRGRTFSNSN